MVRNKIATTFQTTANLPLLGPLVIYQSGFPSLMSKTFCNILELEQIDLKLHPEVEWQIVKPLDKSQPGLHPSFSLPRMSCHSEYFCRPFHETFASCYY